MKDQISALLDGELDEVEAGQLIARLKTQPELRRVWDEYHRIGDALRGHLASDVSAAVAPRLAAEVTVFAPQAKEPSMQRMGRWALSAAAGLAAVALVAWVALPVHGPSPQVVQMTPVEPAAAAPGAAAGPQVAVAGDPHPDQLSARHAADANARAQGEALAALGVGNYLLAHQRFSPSSAMQGVAPYVRSVSSERYER